MHEQHYNVQQLAKMWRYSEDTIRDLFIDFAHPNRFDSLGEFVAEIYRVLRAYNHTGIRSALKMPPTSSPGGKQLTNKKAAKKFAEILS